MLWNNKLYIIIFNIKIKKINIKYRNFYYKMIKLDKSVII